MGRALLLVGVDGVLARVHRIVINFFYMLKLRLMIVALRSGLRVDQRNAVLQNLLAVKVLVGLRSPQISVRRVLIESVELVYLLQFLV